eukprot:snap_masked-scaffold_11-processed-gene-12.23-mRNA-1 protein AED:1.00 eAED:1.00 QI:0/-1/0/0/-1/1/1/0/614
MNKKSNINEIILNAVKGKSIKQVKQIQELWSGYGSISTYFFNGSKYSSAVVKHIKLPKESETGHPRGWDTTNSRTRKINSYKVETEFYNQFFNFTNSTCRIPKFIFSQDFSGETILILEDLKAAGFPIVKQDLNWNEIESCINFLANFHATFFQMEPNKLWKTGTYWHLETRPDELEALEDQPLKSAASEIDEALNNSKYKTFVHGDAKVANFLFSRDGKKVAAVDFQYVGGGVGVKDLAYFIGSVLNEKECEKYEAKLLNLYFNYLEEALKQRKIKVDFEDLEKEWRELFFFAWADFHRFVKGWSPGHWKINSYSEKMTKKVLRKLKSRLKYSDLVELREVAVEAATQAEKVIQKYLREGFTVKKKDVGSTEATQVVTEVDLACQEVILKILKPSIAKYDFGILAEEEKDDGSRLIKKYFWTVDPIDGTLPFTKRERGFCVAISLVSKSGDPILGIVLDPVDKNLYTAIKNYGAEKNYKPLFAAEKTSSESLFLYLNNSFKNDNLSLKLIQAFEREGKKVEISSGGGAVMNALWALEKSNGCFFKFPKEKEGGGCIWDFAATVCIYKEALGFVSDSCGGELDLNNPNTIFFNKCGVIYTNSRKVAEKIIHFRR